MIKIFESINDDNINNYLININENFNNVLKSIEKRNELINNIYDLEDIDYYFSTKLNDAKNVENVTEIQFTNFSDFVWDSWLNTLEEITQIRRINILEFKSTNKELYKLSNNFSPLVDDNLNFNNISEFINNAISEHYFDQIDNIIDLSDYVTSNNTNIDVNKFIKEIDVDNEEIKNWLIDINTNMDDINNQISDDLIIFNKIINAYNDMKLRQVSNIKKYISKGVNDDDYI